MRKSDSPVRLFAKSNRELLEAFENYLISLNRSAPTLRSYFDSVARYIEILGSKNAADAGRVDIRRLQMSLLVKGVSENSIRLHVAAIRQFSKFLRLSGLTRHDPTLLLSHRKMPSRVPRVLTVAEVERLIAASETPLERAVVEVLYGTGVRVSEFVALRVEDITFSEPGVIRVLRGKGDKDRIVLFGRKAKAAIERYLNGRATGFLFEAPERMGYVTSNRFSWLGRFYVDGVQQCMTLGRLDSISESEAHAKLQEILAKTPGFHLHPARPYDPRSIRLLLKRLAFRANVASAAVHPHSFRRAVATHMLESGDCLRATQELLGHSRVTTTQIYTNLSASKLVEVYTRCHPHAQEDANAEKK
jgi:site-specific recombinase XerD